MPQNLSCIHTGSMYLHRNTISIDNSGKNTEIFFKPAAEVSLCEKIR